MNNFFKHFLIIVLIAVNGVFFVSCDFNKEDDSNKINISGTPRIGEKITATINGDYSSGPRWDYSENGVDGWSVNFDFVNQKVITIPSTVPYGISSKPSEGKYIRAWLYLNERDSTTGRTKTVYSNVIGPIQP